MVEFISSICNSTFGPNSCTRFSSRLLAFEKRLIPETNLWGRDNFGISISGHTSSAIPQVKDIETRGQLGSCFSHRRWPVAFLPSPARTLLPTDETTVCSPAAALYVSQSARWLGFFVRTELSLSKSPSPFVISPQLYFLLGIICTIPETHVLTTAKSSQPRGIHSSWSVLLQHRPDLRLSGDAPIGHIASVRSVGGPVISLLHCLSFCLSSLSRLRFLLHHDLGAPDRGHLLPLHVPEALTTALRTLSSPPRGALEVCCFARQTTHSLFPLHSQSPA